MSKKIYTVGADVSTIYRYIYTTVAESEEEALANIKEAAYETAEVIQIDTDEDSEPFNLEIIGEETVND